MNRLRALLVVAVAVAVSWLGLRVVAGPIDRAAAALVRGDGLGALPFDVVLAAGCALALAACWLWLATGVVVVVVNELVTGGAGLAGRTLPWPALVRALALASVGVVVTAAPASADRVSAPDLRGHDLVVGLTLPDRVATKARRPTAVRVGPGDSLWSIADRQLGPKATVTAVDRAWRRIARANAHLLGPDPDLIFPGVVLVVPDLGSTLGKEPS